MVFERTSPAIPIVTARRGTRSPLPQYAAFERKLSAESSTILVGADASDGGLVEPHVPVGADPQDGEVVPPCSTSRS